MFIIIVPLTAAEACRLVTVTTAVLSLTVTHQIQGVPVVEVPNQAEANIILDADITLFFKVKVYSQAAAVVKLSDVTFVNTQVAVAAQLAAVAVITGRVSQYQFVFSILYY